MDELAQLLATLNAFTEHSQKQAHFRNLRDPSSSEIFDEFVKIMAAAPVNGYSGQITVESVVSDLRARVGLDNIVAADEVNTDDELKARVAEFCNKYFLHRDHGFTEIESVLEAYKDSNVGYNDIGKHGRDAIYNIIKDVLKQYPRDDLSTGLNAVDHYTSPIVDEHAAQEKSNLGLTSETAR